MSFSDSTRCSFSQYLLATHGTGGCTVTWGNCSGSVSPASTSTLPHGRQPAIFLPRLRFSKLVSSFSGCHSSGALGNQGVTTRWRSSDLLRERWAT